LHVNELISDEEFSALVQREGAVDRLESYDRLRDELTHMKAELAREQQTSSYLRVRQENYEATINILDQTRAERDAALAERDGFAERIDHLLTRIADLSFEKAAAEKRADDAVAAERERCAGIVDGWVEAYPVDIFPKPFQAQVDAAVSALAVVGLTYDMFTANACRHTGTRIAEAIRQAKGSGDATT
jgi:hypothetical protein